MKTSQKTGHKGSLKWIQVLINEYPSVINQEQSRQLRLKFDKIQWLSPLQQDCYAVYRDEAYLEVLGLGHEKDRLRKFWPQRGPQWDALGRAADGGPYFLVEAKANIPEITSTMKASSETSITLIRKSLCETADYLGCRYTELWENGFYQYANRLAHLYFLRQVCGVETYLVFLYFIGDETHISTSQEQWEGALELQKSLLGMKRHKLSKYVVRVFIDTGDIENSEY